MVSKSLLNLSARLTARGGFALYTAVAVLRSMLRQAQLPCEVTVFTMPDTLKPLSTEIQEDYMHSIRKGNVKESWEVQRLTMQGTPNPMNGRSTPFLPTFSKMVCIAATMSLRFCRTS
jgi:hypothetical protein